MKNRRRGYSKLLMLSLEEVFLGVLGDSRKPLFKNTADIARDVAALDVGWNPYFDRERTCAKHLSAIFRGGSTERLSQALYDVLRIVFQQRIDKVARGDADAWQLPDHEMVFEDAARAYVRKFDRPPADSGIKSLEASLTQADTLQLIWAKRAEDFGRLAPILFEALSNARIRIEFFGSGFWEALHRVAVKRGESWDDARDLLASWKLAKRVKVFLQGSSMSVAIVDQDTLKRKVFLLFPEDGEHLVAFRMPPKSADEFVPDVEPENERNVIPIQWEVGEQGEYKHPISGFTNIIADTIMSQMPSEAQQILEAAIAMTPDELEALRRYLMRAGVLKLPLTEKKEMSDLHDQSLTPKETRPQVPRSSKKRTIAGSDKIN